MQPPRQFTGLNMSVFTAFGWIGEENALKFALAQLETFVAALHNQLPRDAQALLPFHGLDRQSQAIYLAANQEVERDIHITFATRPVSFEIALVLTEKKQLEKGFKAADADALVWHRMVTQLGPEWSLHVRQMEYDESAGSTHYQDLFKGPVSELDPDSAAALVSRAAYLNSEEQWVVPFAISRRFSAEQVSVMGLAVLRVMADQVTAVVPLARFMTGNVRRSGSRRRDRGNRPKTAEAMETTLPEGDAEDEFTYVAELMPLHIRQGFVNLTPKHWPFFAINARTETRPVTVYYGGKYDHNNSVWRLVPNDQARLVLSDPVHRWLEDHFGSNDKIRIVARKLENQEIQVALSPTP